MPPVTRKRSAPALPPKENTTSEDESSVSKVTKTPKNNSQLKESKCPWERCGKLFNKTNSLRVHYRTHTKYKPYKCIFESCNKTYPTLTNILQHIRNVHQQSYSNAKKYVKVNSEIIAEESNKLGIKEYLKLDSDLDKTSAIPPTIPTFTTITRTSTGRFKCPLSSCEQTKISITNLKEHYRVHCGPTFRPFRCVVDPSQCQYSTNLKTSIVGHIRSQHGFRNNFDDDYFVENFILTNTSLLEKENELFNNAEIISSPEATIQRPLLYNCTFSNCPRKFINLINLRHHLRAHSQTKPFICTFPKCNQAATLKSTLIQHIHSAHFNVCQRIQKSFSSGEKARVERYIGVRQEVLDEEEAQIESLRIRTKRRRRRKNGVNILANEDDPNYMKVEFDDDEATEDEEKDKLPALLATTTSTIFSE